MSEVVAVSIASPAEPPGEVFVIGCFEGEELAVAGLHNEVAAAALGAYRRPGFRGGEKQLSEAPRASGGTVLLAGLGTRAAFTERRFSQWLDRLIEGIETQGGATVTLCLPDAAPTRGEAAAERLCRRLALAGYRFDRFKAAASSGAPLRSFGVVPPEGEGAVYRAALGPARAAALGISFARDLANTPANVADPGWMEDRCHELGTAHGIEVEVYGVPELTARGMGGVLAVGQGSRVPPRLVRLRWGSRGPRVALVGKGVTFDTGGISIKPAQQMDEMKYDKGGACAVLGVLRAARELALEVQLTAYLPFAENMPDGAAYRPSDIIRCYNGKTVEITNTDAEGRLLLADALALAVEEGPDAILEFSTLTGGCVVALGHHGAGLFTPDDRLATELLQSADAAGERLWRLPLWPEFADEMRGNHADLKNSAGRWGSAATAAAFLAAFVGEFGRWAHVDMAGPVLEPSETNGAKGATGYGVALTLDWLRRLSA